MVQRATGFNATRVGFVIAVLGVLGVISMLMNGLHSDKKGERFLHVIVPCLVSGVGFLVAGVSTGPVTLLIRLCMHHDWLQRCNAAVWTIPCSFLAGKSAAAGIAAINMIAIVGGFVGPYWMGLAAELSGSYERGILACAVPVFAAAVLMVGIRRFALRSAPSADAPC